MTTKIKEYSFVLDSNGNKLTPTNINKAGYLIRKGRAKLINKYPMTIQLIDKVIDKNEIDNSSIYLGIDDGSRYVGLALVQKCKTSNKVLYKIELEQRTDVKNKMSARSSFRRFRRYNKRYREQRYDNRASSRRIGRLPPTIFQKKEAILRLVNFINKYIRIDHIYLEDVRFKIRSIENKKSYNNNSYIDENIRIPVIIRDDNTCQLCGSNNRRIEIHHIIPRSKSGPTSINNLICLCKHCHRDIVNGNESKYQDMFFKKINSKDIINYKDAHHVVIGKKYLQSKLKEISNLTLTIGADTANFRNTLHINKTHTNDAVCITGLEVSNKVINSIKEWKVKPLRRQCKGSADKPLNGFTYRDYVLYSPRKYNGKVSPPSYGYISAINHERNSISIITKTKIHTWIKTNNVKLVWRFNKLIWFNE